MRRLLVILALVALPALADDTGFLSPGSNAARTATWTTPANAHDETDATVAVTGTTSANEHDFTNLSIAIDAGSIDGVEVQFEHAHDRDTWTGTWTCQLIDAAGTLCGSPKTSVDHGHGAEQTDALGGAADTWGCTLTEAIVEDVDFGAACYYTKTAGGGGNKLDVDEIKIKVYYTLPSRRRVYIN